MITGPQARELGRKIVFENPAGIGPTAIGQKILALHPDMKDDKGRPNGTIRGAVWDLDKRFADIMKTGAGFAPKAGAAAPEDSEAVERRLSDTCLPPPSAPMPEPPPRRASKNTGRASRHRLQDRSRALSAPWPSKIAALEDAVSQAHAEIENRDAQIADLKVALSKWQDLAGKSAREAELYLASADKLQAQLGAIGTDQIGVIAEAQNAAVLVDIRQAVLAGSEEGTLEAVRRVVDELGKVRTQLALTGIKDDGKRLKAARKLAGVTQKALGSRLGFSGRSVIDLIERGMSTLAKHPDVLKWVQKIEADHVEGESGSVHETRKENPTHRSGSRHPAGGRETSSARVRGGARRKGRVRG